MKENEDIDLKLKLVKNILKNVERIFILFKPLLQEMMKLEEARKFAEDGTFNHAQSLFDEINKDCMELTKSPFLDDFMKNLKN